MAGTTARRPLRADARRNYERILAAAQQAFAAHGADASLEGIARQAGVGSATLHRHFPSRHALLDAVFHEVALLDDGTRRLVTAVCSSPQARPDEVSAVGARCWIRLNNRKG